MDGQSSGGSHSQIVWKAQFKSDKAPRRHGIFPPSTVVVALLCGAAFQVLLHLSPLWAESVLRLVVLDLFYMLGYSVLINLILAVFNMIPVPPLDGSRILSMVLPPQYAAKFAYIERFGMIILIFLLFTGMLNGIMSFFVEPMLRIFLGNQGMSIFLHFIMN